MSIKPTQPAPVFPPGTYIDEWFTDEKMSQREFAHRIGVSQKQLSQLINGHLRISPEMAAKLASVTGYSTEFWLEEQARHDARQAKIQVSEEDIARVEERFDGETIARLKNAGLVAKDWQQPEELVREIFMLAKVTTLDALEYVMSSRAEVDHRNIADDGIAMAGVWSWLEIVNYRAWQQDDIAPYDRQKLLDAVPKLRAATQLEPAQFLPKVTEILGEAGVHFVAESDIAGARISGAAFVSQDDQQAVAVTDRGKREDIFWFTVFHEISHVLNNDYDGAVHIDRDDASMDESQNDRERKADEWAASQLLIGIDAEELANVTDLEQVGKLAERAGISPGIVIGQLQISAATTPGAASESALSALRISRRTDPLSAVDSNHGTGKFIN